MRIAIITIFFTSILFSSQMQKLDFSKTIMQVGAFKKNSSLIKTKKLLSSYNLLSKQINGYIKLFIINPSKSEILKIKKIIPSAFVLSTKTKKKIFRQPTKKSKILVINLNNNTSSDLNTNTIIKTRKKFFK